MLRLQIYRKAIPDIPVPRNFFQRMLLLKPTFPTRWQSRFFQKNRIKLLQQVVTSMVATAFPSSAIASCAMHATSPSRIGPAEPTDFFPALGQHPPAAVFAVAASPTRVLPIIDSSLSVEASSTNIGGPAPDGHLRSQFPAQVQPFDSIPATALQTPVGRSAIVSIASMQVSPRPSPNGTINEIIDADNSLMFNIPWYNLCPRTKLLELQEMWLHHLDLIYLAIVSGDLELSYDPDLDFGGLDLLVEHGIQLDWVT
ncbi:hypothetical protein BTUL_0005g01550 [Botrytis tulipae]|uniref:Uncharacterized protein n=1 Tax=Botrytis tulipae TaxID=87230 RepID=A0A4Z1F4D6_9HELO|nr:hypothetical protein BTUL_0005g01550 [Botrytis tulipae]